MDDPIVVQHLSAEHGVEYTSTADGLLNKEEVQDLKDCVFNDQQWKDAVQFLTGIDGWDRSKAAAVLRQGAKPFGIWRLSDASLEGLIEQVMGSAGGPSPGLKSWLDLVDPGKLWHDNSPKEDRDHDIDIDTGIDVGISSPPVSLIPRTPQRDAANGTKAEISACSHIVDIDLHNSNTDQGNPMNKDDIGMESDSESSSEADDFGVTATTKSQHMKQKVSISDKKVNNGSEAHDVGATATTKSNPWKLKVSFSDKKVNNGSEAPAFEETPTITSKHTQKSQHMKRRRKVSVSDATVNKAFRKPRPKSVHMLKKIKWFLNFTVFVVSNVATIKGLTQSYPDAIKYFGWPVYVARVGGMATACWTAILYATMSRSVMSWLSLRLPKNDVSLTIFDAHKDLHVYAGIWLSVWAAGHTIAHCIGTIPGMLASSVEEMNGILGCANMNSSSGVLPVDLSILSWPPCPLEEIPKDFTEVLFLTMPGVTGILLTVLLAAVGYTGRRTARAEKFERFIYLHYVLVVLWPILLFLHGSQNWIGVGFPLVAFTCSLPIAAYALDRLLRCLRYYMYAGSQVGIVSCTLRPGEAHEGLAFLHIHPPPHLWSFHPGMYAFLCMPEYSLFQWHPFTICSGADDETVDFLIADAGDWSSELVRRLEEVGESGGPLPMIGIDGPYTAATQGAMFKKVFIAVGAGVGITPFLSLMASLISITEDRARASKLPLKEAHFFWITRSVDEFLFGQGLFSKLLHSQHLRHRIFLHLHTTAKAPGNDVQSYIFREALKKQSALDRKAFAHALSKIEDNVPGFSQRSSTNDSILRRGRTILKWTEAQSRKQTQAFDDKQPIGNQSQSIKGLQIPWGWINGAEHDVLFMTDLAEKRKTGRGTMSLEGYGEALRGATSADLEAAQPLDHQMKVGKSERSDIQPTGARNRQFAHGGAMPLMPVVFGRPDFGMEIRAIGQARPNHDVDIYVCGNKGILKVLQQTAVVCNEHAEQDFKSCGGRQQNYTVHYERFG